MTWPWRGDTLMAYTENVDWLQLEGGYSLVLLVSQSSIIKESLMSDTLSIGELPTEARRELLDFYEFLMAKYRGQVSGGISSASDPYLYEKVKIDTTKLHFSRDEIHERG